MDSIYDVIRVLVRQAPNVSEDVKAAMHDVLDKVDPAVKQAESDAAAIAERAERAELDRLREKFEGRQAPAAPAATSPELGALGEQVAARQAASGG
jgi:hypothetical protein